VAAYIAHRLRTAGSDGRVVFDRRAVRLVRRYSGGIPRLINAVCDGALLAGFVAGTFSIDAGCVRRAIAHLQGRE
jgi:general secretion pathway protein A